MLGSQSGAPDASTVLTAMSAHAAGISTLTQSKLGASASNLVVPAPVEVIKSESSSGKTSVGLTVGMCFLGLGVGLLIAFCVAYFCMQSMANTKPVHLPEMSSNRGDMEMSRNGGETYA